MIAMSEDQQQRMAAGEEAIVVLSRSLGQKQRVGKTEGQKQGQKRGPKNRVADSGVSPTAL